MTSINLCRYPYCGSYHYEVGYFTSGANCRCCDCGSLIYHFEDIIKWAYADEIFPKI